MNEIEQMKLEAQAAIADETVNVSAAKDILARTDAAINDIASMVERIAAGQSVKPETARKMQVALQKAAPVRKRAMNLLESSTANLAEARSVMGHLEVMG